MAALLAGARVVTPGGVIEGGWVQTEAGVITAMSPGPRPPGEAVDLAGAWLLPGYIDLHVHGGGGHDASASPADLAAAVAFHRQHGTTRTLVSLVAAPLEALAEQLAWIADRVAIGPTAQGHVLGAHLEGPFLSAARCGAQNPGHLLRPDTAAFARLAAAARGTLRSITIAPELPGALDLIAAARAAGAVAAVGHTDATYAQARVGLDAGLRLATHLFNGMRPVHHREPGVVVAVLEGRIAFEIINDGIHVHPALIRLLAREEPEQLLLVTDAISAAGTGDGEFLLGGLQAVARDGAARLAATGTLAGSTLTMDAAVRRAVVECGLPIEVASAAASANPARVLGIGDRCGAIAVGHDADLVVLDDELRLLRVMAGGSWCDG
ncbi:MAG TPA: N-acetylglucosamine-6-phosphate deacetylase [Streptosporangiaceae bacterium]|nr:N-acetylglucosamine-6-phosphate deacetylase [Streptosporangiaceae bacterium]